MAPPHPHPPTRPLAGPLAAALLLTALLPATSARAMVGEGADEGVVPTLSQDYTVVPASRLAAAVKADRDYVTGMRAHHAGALSMSEEYLRDPAAGSPLLKVLARAIIHNQRFEIALLDDVAGNLDRPPTVIGTGPGRIAVQPAALEGEGMALRYRFTKYPIPTPLTAPMGPVTARDVQFAKAMTVHHRGALDMANAYQADLEARNTFLGLLNVDIITDQTQEIALMRRAIAAYPGDPEAIAVPAGMVHGMEGMSHGGDAAPPAAPSPAATPHAGGHGIAPGQGAAPAMRRPAGAMRHAH